VIGIAREIAALTKSKFSVPEVHYDELGDAINLSASVQIVEPDLCPRYCASLLTGVKVGTSPQWLQQRLLACGMRPISNVVDVTNYVMMEYGQPLHAFDFKKVRGGQIIVRRGKEGEVITTLDGVERALKSNMLVIADKEGVVAVAGVMGGAATEVTDSTTTVLIESANFNRAIVHGGSIDLKLSSEASLRFEKGLSPELAMVALKRVTQLMMELTGGKVAKGIIDVYPGKRKIEPILLSAGEVKRLLGIEVDTGEIIEALELLGFSCRSTESSLNVSVNIPWWRTDISCAADLVEEVARIFGYDNIPATMLSAPLPTYEPAPLVPLRERLRSIIVSCGFQEVLNYSLTNIEAISKLSPQLNLTGLEPLKLSNPMSRELESMRTTLRAGILSTLARNQRYQQKCLRVFELGKVFLPRKGDLPQEKEMLCAVLCGLQDEPFWSGSNKSVDFFIAKGVVETLLSRLGLVADFVPGDDESLCPGKNAFIFAGKEKIGVIGELHPRVMAAFDLSEAVFIVELDLDKLLSLISSSYVYQPIPRYPSVIRDIALVVDESVTYQQIYDVIRKQSLIKQVSLFDLYRGEQIPVGKKSLAFRIVYQSSTHTLSDEKVDEVQKHILDRLSKELGAVLRT
jgi:phenylalanyl-tRNA synthetase beta chain